MTIEIFRDDAYARTTEAQILAVNDDGIVLDQTVFYPEGGGQPGDRGSIILGDGSAITIIDTRNNEAGALLHIPAAGQAMPAANDRVTASIDWDYRYRHMRTHTCLHLLCALIPYDVTGGSISQVKGRLDFDMSDPLDKEAVQQALLQLIAEDRVVGYRWITDEEMKNNMDLVRTMSVKPPMGQDRVRLVEISEVDLQPCGGTHVAHTGEIGEVRIGKVEKKGKHNRRINIHLE
ncbi:MAG: alanyl-tRNA editing protein [Gammaproteobacteria bacterium]|nr:alanyl-tRNA editing protein [Gammaproteobacteria bacterium]